MVLNKEMRKDERWRRRSHLHKRKNGISPGKDAKSSKGKSEGDKEESRGEGKGIKHRRVGMGFSQKRDLT